MEYGYFVDCEHHKNLLRDVIQTVEISYMEYSTGYCVYS